MSSYILKAIIFAGLVALLNAQQQSSFIIDLSDKWTVLNSKRGIEIPNMSIPFSVHSALIREKKIPNPLYRYNDLELRWIPKDNNWVFVKLFNVEQDLKSVIMNLEFFTIDTVGNLFLTFLIFQLLSHFCL